MNNLSECPNFIKIFFIDLKRAVSGFLSLNNISGAQSINIKEKIAFDTKIKKLQ